MNVLMVAIDTLRADHLECYGYPKKTSPTLAKFAKQGVLFENYFAPGIPTDPSYMSVFTGMDTYGHQITNVRPMRRLAPEIKTLAEVLQRKGYFTACVSSLKGHLVDFVRGFDVELGYKGPLQDSEKRVKRHAEAVNANALPLLGDLKDVQPFFYFVHYWDPHTPYWPPEPYVRMFYDKPKGAERDPKNLSMRPALAFDGFRMMYENWIGADITDVDYVNALYDAEIRYNSDHLAKLFARMKRLRLWDDTLVIVFSDHGEILDDHTGQYDHHGLYEGDIHVPLIIRFPGSKHGGKRIEAMTANVDLAPTVLDLLGVSVPRQMEGRSLMPLVKGRRKEQCPEIYLTEATWQCKHGVRTKEWKFIRAINTSAKFNWHGEGQRELYNLVIDPEEQTNVIHVRPRVAAELERRLDAWLAAQKRRYGHNDPIRTKAPSLGGWRLADVRKADLESKEPIR